jgi:hypothetical protein
VSQLLTLDCSSSADSWCRNSAEIAIEIQRLGDSMSLPSLASIISDRKVVKAIELGSNLPTASLSAFNRKKSLVTSKPINGFPVTLEDNMSYMSVNEVLMWTQVNPFSPTFSGSFLTSYSKI